jgi:quinolinate synthase
MTEQAAMTEFPCPEWHDSLSVDYAWLARRLGKTAPCIDLEWQLPWIDAIRRLKAQRGACILAHNYQAPEIFHGIADVTGDSLALAEAAARSDSPLIVMCGVHFMAETTKLLAPDRRVLIPSMQAGCSLAASIDAAQVLALRRRHPGIPVVSYVNTSAEVKAESDICCTSANAVEVVESLGVPRVIFLPDRHLGSHVASRTQVELILWDGACEVHESFSAAQLRRLRKQSQAAIVAHPECPAEVRAEADFVGSTAAMAAWLERERPARVALVTECAMADNLRGEFPQIEFVSACNLCPHMKRIDLPSVYACLRDLRHEVLLVPAVAAPARRALERMLAVGRHERA